MSEKILVVPTDALFGKNKERHFQGFIPSNESDFQSIINTHSKFIFRYDASDEQKLPAEQDESHKQIIPYIILKHKDKYFVYKRLKNSEEERLRYGFSVGIGGHINPVDITNGNPLINAMKREVEEELNFNFNGSPKILGYINDDSNSVGRVHFGVVFLIESPRSEVEVREKDKLSGSFMSLEQIEKIKDNFENWSKIVYDAVGKDLVK